MFRVNRWQARNGERTISLTRWLRIDTRYLGRNCIIYVTTFHSQVDTREANVNATIKPPEKEKTETDAMQRGTAWHGDASFPLRECDCRRSIDGRRHYAEARMNCDKRKDEQTGKCFRVVPCTILLLLNTNDALTLGERRMVSELRRRNEKGKALLRGVLHHKCHSSLDLCTCTCLISQL